MCWMCDATGEMQTCADCGKMICFDVKSGDDIIRPALGTSDGDVYCDRHAEQHERELDDTDGLENWPPDYDGDDYQPDEPFNDLLGGARDA